MFTEWEDLDKYKENLIDIAYDKPDALADIYRGHTIELHTNQNDIELI